MFFINHRTMNATGELTKRDRVPNTTQIKLVSKNTAFLPIESMMGPSCVQQALAQAETFKVFRFGKHCWPPFLPDLSCRALLNEVLMIKEVIKVLRKGR